MAEPMKPARMPVVSFALGLLSVAVLVGSGVAFAIADATDFQPRASSAELASRSVFLLAPPLVLPRLAAHLLAWLPPASVDLGSAADGVGAAGSLAAAA